MNQTNLQKVSPSDIAIIGHPLDKNSSYLTGPAKAPELIIQSFESSSANYFTESIIDLKGHDRLKWLGSPEVEDFFDITERTHSVLKRGAIPFGLGGDHSIVYPIIKGVFEAHGPVTILQFDAHNDLYDDFEGNPHSHASPFARIMESGYAKHLIQVGTRTTTLHQKEQIERFGVACYDMKSWHSFKPESLKGPLYVSFDMDALDPAFAPGVSHHEPGGLSTREVLNILQKITAPIVGMDLVEYNPDRDINGITGMVAAKIFKEMVDVVLRNNH